MRKTENPRDYIGQKLNGIEILDVYLAPSGVWCAQVSCTCGRVFKTMLSAAKRLNRCNHVFRKWREEKDDKNDEE